MRKRLTVALLVVIALSVATAPVVQAANVTNVDAPDVTMDPGTVTSDLEVYNDGNASAADVTIDDTPAGVSVSHPGSETLESDQTTAVTIEIEADNTADSGTVSGDVNGEPFSFELTVNTPPLAGFEDEPLDLGDVLVSETASGEVTVEEVSGDGSLDGVDWTVVSDDPNADLTFSEMRSVSGSEGTADWSVDVDGGVEQHETLSWTVEVADSRYPDASREVDVEARVIYPGYFGELAVEDEFVFDEPRSQGELTKPLELDIENAGDRPLEVDSVSAFVSNSDLSVSAPNAPDEIDAGSTETVDLSVTADTSLPEGEYDIEASASANDFEIEDGSYSGQVEIVHGTQLTADDINLGDVPIGQPQTATTELREELGYNDLSTVQITRSSGPDNWISIGSTPSSLGASGSETASFGLEFDTSADLGTQYEWEYTVDGGRDTEQVTITATPIPLDLDPIRSDISGYDGPVADNTLAIVNRMDEQIRSGRTDDDQISAVLAFGDAATLYLGAVENANEQIANDNHADAQQEVIRAATALNTMSLYAEGISSSQQQAASQEVISSAEADVDDLVDQQVDYYETQLDSGELTLIEEATVKRQLAQMAALQGDNERSTQLEAESSTAFDSYVETVSSGEQDVQEAKTAWSRMESDQFVTVLGQPLLFNPAAYDSFSERSDEMDAAYQSAIASFEEAGATNRAEAVAAEHDSRMTGITIATISLFLSIAIYAIVSVGLIGRTASQMYWYVQDSREAVSGDFLL